MKGYTHITTSSVIVSDMSAYNKQVTYTTEELLALIDADKTARMWMSQSREDWSQSWNAYFIGVGKQVDGIRAPICPPNPKVSNIFTPSGQRVKDYRRPSMLKGAGLFSVPN
jgi:hypothetical protein